MAKISDRHELVEVYAMDFFDDPEFARWLNSRVGQGLATWHIDGEPGEMSDIFVIYDGGEGDESSYNPLGMPEKFWLQLCKLCEDAGIQYAVLRLLNFGNEEELEEEEEAA